MLRIDMSGRPAAFVVAFLVLLAPAGAGEAPLPGGKQQGVPGLIDDNDLGQVNIGLIADLPASEKMEPEPLRDVLSREGQFMAKVGELSSAEVESFLREGEKALMLHGGHLADGEMKFTGTRGLIAFNGRFMAFEEPPNRNARRILAAVLKRISPAARERFDAESQRLEAYRRRAAGIINIAELDDALLLSNEQREKLQEILAAGRGVPFAPMNDFSPLVRIRLPQKNLIAAGSLGSFAVPESELSTVLRPWQLASYKKLGQPALQEMVVIEQLVRGPAADAPARRPGVRRTVAVGAKVRAQREVVDEHGVRHRLSRTDLLQRLETHLSRLVEDVALSCGLTESERGKLLLAGKLDILALRERTPREELPGGEMVFQEVARVPAIGPRLPPAIFDDAGSAFQKALEHGLSAEQKEKLATARRERREFRRQALAEVVVVGFERSAALTSAQCEKLSSALDEALAAGNEDTAQQMPADQRAVSDWQIECLRLIARLPDETLQPLFIDFQRPAAMRQRERLAEAIRRMEARATANAKIRVSDAQGSVLEFDALQVDGNP
ncbi:MAG TPA: hypothetical protein VMV10_25710 [Pirellulales bacterium]|nr:hypothetical protein [Pirellulales bacterium]